MADVLAKLLGGHVTRFWPYEGSFIAWSRDAAGTVIEVYPVGTEMFPDKGDWQANFRHDPTATPFVATPVAVRWPAIQSSNSLTAVERGEPIGDIVSAGVIDASRKRLRHHALCARCALVE